MPSSEPRTVVTIEGSLTPCVELPRGQSRTVQLTPQVQSLIDQGFVVVTSVVETAVSPPPKQPAKRRSAPKPPAQPEEAPDA